MTRSISFILGLSCAALAAFGHAAPLYAGDFLFQLDNDKVADTDRHYTNGVRFSYVPTDPAFQLTETTDFLVDWFGMGGFVDATPSSRPPASRRVGWAVGQEIYTPEDVDATVPNPQDRPYAGWTYLAATVQNELKNGFGGLDQFDTLELNVGIVGPESRAGETQNWIHRLINVSESNGWRHQIDTEPGLLLSRTLKLRSPSWSPWGRNEAPDATGFDLIGHTTGQFGNIRTGAAAGVTLRFGGNLSQDFGPNYGTFDQPHKPPGGFVWSFYAGTEVRAVAHDIFLDGNTFKDNPDVKRNPLVLESRGGVMVHVPKYDPWGTPGFRFDLSHVQRSREFATQDKSDRYGSVKVTLNF